MEYMISRREDWVRMLINTASEPCNKESSQADLVFANPFPLAFTVDLTLHL